MSIHLPNIKNQLFRFLRLIGNFFVAVYYSLPAQLLINQFRNHKFILLFWVFLFLVITRQILTELGGPYLFLEPEYNNSFGFFSMFLLGIGIGIFCLAYQMTMFILDGYRFFFLSLEKHSFIKFSINNSFLPGLFWVIYSYAFIDFQINNPIHTNLDTVLLLVGAYLGGVIVTVLSVTYFSLTNKDIFKLLGERVVNELRNPRILIREARRTVRLNIRVDYYISGRLRIGKVRHTRGDFRTIVRVLNQNHANALIAQVIIFIVLLILGLFQEYPYFRIPAGTSFLILFSFFVMLIGALTFWFRRIGLLALLLVTLGFTIINQLEPFVGQNYAFGIDYQQPPTPYSNQVIKAGIQPQLVKRDYQNTLRILENWRKQQQLTLKPGKKPKLLVLCVSGGGIRSAVWTMRSLQYGDSLTGGKLRSRLQLVTGASGGMMGAAYFRELMLKKQHQPDLNLYDPQYTENASLDCLNPIISRLVTNLFFPHLRLEDQGRVYERDRGYAFENQLNENTGFVFDNKRLRDYALPEFEGKVPMMLFTPAITNDGRKLFISPHGVSYMLNPMVFNETYTSEVAGVEFSRLFSQHDPMNIRFTSVIRMNATFPTILPYVELPSDPPILIMDAGAIDNFGITTAARYLSVFRDWLIENTDGVILLQIRDSRREMQISKTIDRTILSKIGATLGGTYTTFSESKDFMFDEYVEDAWRAFGGKLDMLELQYIPNGTFREASLSFHLTEREKDDILSSIYNPENQAVFRRLKKLLNDG